MASRIINLNNTSPAATSGYQLGLWQLGPTSGTDPATGEPIYPVSAEVPNTGGVNAQTANYTAVAGDCGKLLSFNSSSALTLTLPSTPPFPQWEIDIENAGAGVLSVARGGSATIDGSTTSLIVLRNTGLRIKTDGTNYFTVRGGGSIPISYPGTGSLTIVSAANPSTVNLTTEGTFDWLFPNGTTTTPSSGNTNISMKRISGTGYLLANGFAWSGGSGTDTVYTQNFSTPAVTATATDDLIARGASSAVAGQGVYSVQSAAISYGFRLSIPIGQVSRTLRIYSSVFSGTATCTASLSDGSASTVTATISAAASSNYEGYFTIVANAGRDGQFLTVSVLLTTNLGSTPNVKFMAATLQ
jgi:hypothetical protein